MKYYIDKRVMPNGKKSQILLDNPFGLTDYIETLIWQFSLTGAQNGLNIQSIISSSGVQLNYVELGGTLLHNTVIDGDSLTYSIDFSNMENFNTSGTFSTNEFSDSIIYRSDTVLIDTINSLQLATPNINNNTAVSGQVLTLIDSNTGDCEWVNKKYVHTFVIADWVGTDIIITATTHGMGANPIVQVINTTTNYVAPPLGPGNVLNTIKITSNGDVTIVNGLGAFDGKIIII
jgi:hypothetical protein